MGCCMACGAVGCAELWPSEGPEPKREWDLARYQEAESVFGTLAALVEGHHPVRLVRMTWLIQQRGSVLPRRQEVPEKAFISSAELRAVWEESGRGGLDKVLPVITISSCWDTHEHPDPKGLQLKLVAETLEAESNKYAAGEGSFTGFREMGVFWDWLSLLQAKDKRLKEANDTELGARLFVLSDADAVLKACREAGIDTNDHFCRACAGKAVIVKAIDTSDDTVECHMPSLAMDFWLAARALAKQSPEEEAEEARLAAKRTASEKAAFDYALYETMDLWCAHQGTTVFLLTGHPRERGSARERGYDDSGWTTYERCSAAQIKKAHRIHARWPALVDIGGGQGGARSAGRRWPVGPDRFDHMIASRSFTNGSDAEAVKKLFRGMSRAKLGGVVALDFTGMPPPNHEEADGLAECLRLCPNLRKLDMAGVDLSGRGAFGALASALSSGALGSLEELYLGRASLGPESAAALASALPALPQLGVLQLRGNELGREGEEAVRAACGGHGVGLGL